MSDPYRTAPPPDSLPALHACTDDSPRCYSSSEIAATLRDQARLQRRTLSVAKWALALGVASWAVIAGWALGNVAVSAPVATTVVSCPQETHEPVAVPSWREDRPTVQQIAHAFSQDLATSDTVRAKARANELLLEALEDPSVTVHQVSMTSPETDRLLADHDLRTRVMPVDLGGGVRGAKLVRLSERGAWDRMGLRAGDVVVRFNGRLLEEPEGALAAYQEAVHARHAVVELRRGQARHVVSVRWDS